MQTLEERLRLTVGKTITTHNRLIPLFKRERVTTPPIVLAYIQKAKRRLPAKDRAGWETAQALKLIQDFHKDVHKEFMREYRETMKFLEKKGAFDDLYEYAQEEHPEAYSEEKLLTLEKTKKEDIDEINRYFRGWEENVKPEKMEEVIGYYKQKAGEIGGNRALSQLGIKIAFNLKNPEMLNAIERRGAKITGGITKQTLQNFKDTMYKQYMEVGASPYELRKRIKDMFEQTYKNRAFTIARTETGTAQSEVQFETFKKNHVTKKEWLAVGDDKTRESHLMVNGEVRNIDEEFSNGLMYPLDPSAPPEEVINCRCTLLQYETEGDPCTGEAGDSADCNIPWTGGEDIGATPNLDDNLEELYAKPLSEGGMGMMEMVKMSSKELSKLESYLERGQMNKAYTLLGKYSGRKTSTIKGMSEYQKKRAIQAYKNCIK